MTDHKRNDRKQEVAEKLDDVLRHGAMESESTQEAARARLIPETEIRIVAKNDPIKEETHRIKKVIIEENERYNAYDRE
jgi:hypothetical protein